MFFPQFTTFEVSLPRPLSFMALYSPGRGSWAPLLQQGPGALQAQLWASKGLLLLTHREGNGWQHIPAASYPPAEAKHSGTGAFLRARGSSHLCPPAWLLHSCEPCEAAHPWGTQSHPEHLLPCWHGQGLWTECVGGCMQTLHLSGGEMKAYWRRNQP